MKKHLTFFLICAILIGACKKTETQTQGELTGIALSKAIANTPINLVYVWDGSTNLTINGSGITVLNDGLANISGNNGATVNLETLKYWVLEPSASAGFYVLNLYY
jgi:hypothetical protein